MYPTRSTVQAALIRAGLTREAAVRESAHDGPIATGSRSRDEINGFHLSHVSGFDSRSVHLFLTTRGS